MVALSEVDNFDKIIWTHDDVAGFEVEMDNSPVPDSSDSLGYSQHDVQLVGERKNCLGLLQKLSEGRVI